jgi:predicted CXXCH cytochrome family protein
MQVPSDLPLLDGRLVCTTCHDNRLSADHARARRLHTPLLRADGSAELCAKCHDPDGTTRRDMHATMLGRAHLRGPADDDPEPSGDDRSRAPPDAASRICLGCHDGSVAAGAADASTPDGLARAAHPALPPIEASHPIGVKYGLDEGRALHPVESLDPRIRLFDGRVGCGSCHSPFARRKALLVMPNPGSQLCLSCHVF